MGFFNLLMIRKIFHSNRLTFKQNPLNRKESQFTFAVMAFDVYFFILNFPLSLFYILYDVNFYTGAFTANQEFGALYNMLLNVMVDLSFCVQAFSFFTNLAFNKLFRQTFLLIVGKLFGIAKFRRIQPTTSNSNSTHPKTQTKARNPAQNIAVL